MQERLVSASDGSDSAICGGITLHSLRNPHIEARRFLDAISQESSDVFIVVGACLGYLLVELHDRYPTSKIISIQLSDFFSKYTHPSIPSWHPSDSCDPGTFLCLHLDDRELASARLIEWRTALQAYPETARTSLIAIKDSIERAYANLATIKTFGMRWFKNTLRNLSYTENVLTWTSGNMPVVVCAAGPSLEAQLPSLHQHRSRFFLIAVASAALSLQAHGLKPDLVVSTDGGNWARLHLYSTIRASIPLGLSLSASCPSAAYKHPILLLGDGFRWQRALASAFEIPCLHLQQRGTVSATAIDLALSVSSGSITICGLDLSNNRTCSHVTPYALDRVFLDVDRRLEPASSGSFKREHSQAGSTAMEIYARWFSSNWHRYGDRVWILPPTHADLRTRETSSLILDGGKNAPTFRASSRKKQSIRTAQDMVQWILSAKGAGIHDELITFLGPEGLERIARSVEKRGNKI